MVHQERGEPLAEAAQRGLVVRQAEHREEAGPEQRHSEHRDRREDHAEGGILERRWLAERAACGMKSRSHVAEARAFLRRGAPWLRERQPCDETRLSSQAHHLVDLMQRRDDVGRSDVLREARDQVGLQREHRPRDHRGDERLAIANVMEHRRMGQTDVARDLLKAQGIRSDRPQALLGRGEDRLASVLGGEAAT